MPEEIELQPEEKQITSDGGPELVEGTPPRWREKLKPHKFKILAGILGIFVFAGATFGAYKLGQKQVQLRIVERPTPTPLITPLPTPTLEPTTNWKTYRNEKYRYEVKYPKNWVIASDIEFPFNDLVVAFETDDTEELIQQGKILLGYSYNLSIRFWPSISEQPEAKMNNIEIRTIEEFFEKVPTVSKIGETIIDGRKAYEYTQGGAGQAYGVLIEEGGQIYSLIFDRRWSKAELSETDKTVLATFRFLK